MKPPPFDYEAPETLERAIELLAGNDEAKALAGGQSLVPLLSLRLTYPDLLVDLRRLPGLSSIEATDEGLRIGAMVTQLDAELDPGVGEHCPLLIAALHHVAHPQIRSRGTVGGSIAHADPASELPAVLLALDGQVHVAGPGDQRRIPAERFFAGVLSTALEPGELITAIGLPAAVPGSGSACVEIARRKGDYALAGSVAHVEVEDGAVADARIAFFGVGSRPIRSAEVEQAAIGNSTGEASAAAAAIAAEMVEPSTDPDLPTDYRRQLISVVARRALGQAMEATG